MQPQECDNGHFDKIFAAWRYGKLLRSEGVSGNFGQPNVKINFDIVFKALRTSKL